MERFVMRALFLIALFCVANRAQAIDVTMPPDATAQEKQFITAVERAFATTNINALTAMNHVVGMSSNELAVINSAFYRSIIQRGFVKIELDRADPATATEHRSPAGAMMRESLPVRWIVIVHHPTRVPGGKSGTRLRAGLLDGQIRFTESEEKK